MVQAEGVHKCFGRSEVLRGIDLDGCVAAR